MYGVTSIVNIIKGEMQPRSMSCSISYVLFSSTPLLPLYAIDVLASHV